MYNWGVSLRDLGDVEAAQANFQEVLAVDSAHPLAQGEIRKTTLFLEGQRQAQRKNYADAITSYRQVIEINGGDYAGATTQIYELLMIQAQALLAEGGTENVRSAYQLYAEAAQLPVADSSSAQRAMNEVAALLPTPTPQPTPRPTANPAKLRFSVANYNDEPRCISIRITGIVPAGWYFAVDGIRHVNGRFDGGGNARACGLNPGQEVTISVIDGNGRVVVGGGGVPSKGSAIMVAVWR